MIATQVWKEESINRAVNGYLNNSLELRKDEVVIDLAFDVRKMRTLLVIGSKFRLDQTERSENFKDIIQSLAQLDVTYKLIYFCTNMDDKVNAWAWDLIKNCSPHTAFKLNQMIVIFSKL